MNKLTLALATAGIIGMASVVYAEEAENQALTAVSGTTISGYVETSMNWQFGDRKSYATNPNLQNGFNLDAVQVSIGKALEEDASVWSAGYKVDLLFGENASTYYGGNVADKVAIQNAYVDLRAPVGNGLDFRVGVFESILGYESQDSYKNPNYSRSFAYNYLESKQQTGVLASYNFDISDWILGVRGGVANAFDNGNDLNVRGSDSARLSYMGALNLIFPESTGFLEGTEIYGGAMNGIDRRCFGADTHDYSSAEAFLVYAGLTLPLPVDGLKFGFAYDYRTQDDAWNRDNQYDSFGMARYNASAFAGYLTYDITDKLTLANRFEYITLGASDGLYGYSISQMAGATVDKPEFLENTFSVSYKLWENVLTRAEFRWDHDLSNQQLLSSDHAVDNVFGLTGNVVYLF